MQNSKLTNSIINMIVSITKTYGEMSGNHNCAYCDSSNISLNKIEDLGQFISLEIHCESCKQEDHYTQKKGEKNV